VNADVFLAFLSLNELPNILDSHDRDPEGPPRLARVINLSRVIAWGSREDRLGRANLGLPIYITSGEFHTDKSRIVLNNDGAVITMFIYSSTQYRFI